MSIEKLERTLKEDGMEIEEFTPEYFISLFKRKGFGGRFLSDISRDLKLSYEIWNKAYQVLDKRRNKMYIDQYLKQIKKNGIKNSKYL